MLPLFSLILACLAPPKGGTLLDSSADTAEDPLPGDTATEDSVPEDTASGDTASGCGESAPVATLDVSFEETEVGSGSDAIHTVIWWTNLDIYAGDTDGDLARWTFELWRAVGDEVLDTDRAADGSEPIDESADDDPDPPPCTTFRVSTGRAWVLSDDPAVSLLVPGEPYTLAVAVRDESGARSEIVTVSGVAPEIGR